MAIRLSIGNRLIVAGGTIILIGGLFLVLVFMRREPDMCWPQTDQIRVVTVTYTERQQKVPTGELRRTFSGAALSTAIFPPRIKQILDILSDRTFAWERYYFTTPTGNWISLVFDLADDKQDFTVSIFTSEGSCSAFRNISKGQYQKRLSDAACRELVAATGLKEYLR